MKMHEYNRALDLRQLQQMMQEFRSNDRLNTVINTDITNQKQFHTDQAAYYLSEAGYYDAKAGRIQSLSNSRLRELRALRTAINARDEAEIGVFRAGIVAETAANRERRLLEERQTADFTTLLRTGLAVTTEQGEQITAERAVQTARRTAVTGREGVLTEQDRTSGLMATALTQRGRLIAGQRQVASAQFSAASAQATAVEAQVPFVERTRRAGMDTFYAERRLSRAGHAQRVQARGQELAQEVGAIEASGAARGHTGSFQAVRAAQAEQAAARDVARFELENDVQEMQLAQRRVAINREFTAETGRLGVARRQADVAAKQATAATLRADVASAELGVERGRLAERRAETGAARKDYAVEKARITAAEKQLDTRAAEVTNIQAQLRSRAAQGKQEVKIREKERLARVAVGREQLKLATKRAELLTAQDTARAEEITREGIETTEAKAAATLSAARSRRERAQELRQKSALDVDKKRVDERVRLENLAEAVVRWQISNLPSAKEYEAGREGPSRLGIFLQGLATVFG